MREDQLGESIHIMTQINPFDNVLPADYAAHAIVPQIAGRELFARLEVVAMQPRVVVDVGSKIGDFAALLQERFPTAQVFAIDSVKSMLDYAKKTHGDKIHWVLESGNQLPFKDQSVDLLFSNMCLPWCEHLDVMLHEWRRILRPDGLLVFTSLGPDTVREYPSSTLHLMDMHDLGDALIHAGFQDPIMDVETVTLNYKEPTQLRLEGEIMGLIEPKQTVSTLSITIEMLFGHAWGPMHAQGFAADDAGVVKIPLSHLRRRMQR